MLASERPAWLLGRQCGFVTAKVKFLYGGGFVKLYPSFVVGGVYLRTDTGELIGRLDATGGPFATLEEAREKADWLEMTLQFHRSLKRVSNDQIVSGCTPLPNA